MKIDNFRGELTDISAKKAALVISDCFRVGANVAWRWMCLTRGDTLNGQLYTVNHHVLAVPGGKQLSFPRRDVELVKAQLFGVQLM